MQRALFILIGVLCVVSFVSVANIQQFTISQTSGSDKLVQQLITTNEDLRAQLTEVMAALNKQQNTIQVSQQASQTLLQDLISTRGSDTQHDRHVRSEVLDTKDILGYLSQPRKQVFFDLGANKGDTVLLFTGAAEKALGGADKMFAYAQKFPGPWDIIMYEGHPKYDEPIESVKKYVESLDVTTYGGPYTIYKHNSTAIGWEEGVIEFYMDTNSKEVWGSSIFKNAPDHDSNKPNSVIKIPIHDLIKEIMYNYKVSDYVIVKMDIEGAEFDILNEMLVRGAMPFVDELYVEYHHHTDYKDRVKCYKGELGLLDLAGTKYMKIGTWD